MRWFRYSSGESRAPQLRTERYPSGCFQCHRHFPAGYNEWPVPVKKPSAGAILVSLIPFVAMCFSVALWDRVYPMILGLPFNLAWLMGWIALSTVCLWTAYRLEIPRNEKNGKAR